MAASEHVAQYREENIEIHHLGVELERLRKCYLEAQ
jgi:hypothetical protein